KISTELKHWRSLVLMLLLSESAVEGSSAMISHGTVVFFSKEKQFGFIESEISKKVRFELSDSAVVKETIKGAELVRAELSPPKAGDDLIFIAKKSGGRWRAGL